MSLRGEGGHLRDICRVVVGYYYDCLDGVWGDDMPGIYDILSRAGVSDEEMREARDYFSRADRRDIL